MSGPRPATAGVVLAGGAGRRIGQPKAALCLAGRPLLIHALELISPLASPVIVSTRAGIALPPLPEGVAIAADRAGDPDAPLSGLTSALRYLLGAVPTPGDVAVLACDLPLAGPLLARILAMPPGAVVVGSDPAGRAQPLCARYPLVATLESAEAALWGGELRLSALLDALRRRGLEVLSVAATGDQLANLNRPEDLDRVSAALG